MEETDITTPKNDSNSRELIEIVCLYKKPSSDRGKDTKQPNHRPLKTPPIKEPPTALPHPRKTTEKRPEIVTILRPKQKSERLRSSSSQERPNMRNDRWKTVVYPTNGSQPDRDAEQLTRDARASVESAGIRQVLNCERRRGRTPKEMPKNYPGYDIESVNLDGSVRYIEVKSFRWYWSGDGSFQGHTIEVRRSHRFKLVVSHHRDRFP